MKLKILIITLHILTVSSYGQNKDIFKIDTLIYSYEIIHRDTTVNNYSSGTFGTDNYKTWDTTIIVAEIIFNKLPLEYEYLPFSYYVKKTIMEKEQVDTAILFRDRQSSVLYRLSSQFAYKELEKRKGYLGTIKK